MKVLSGEPGRLWEEHEVPASVIPGDLSAGKVTHTSPSLTFYKVLKRKFPSIIQGTLRLWKPFMCSSAHMMHECMHMLICKHRT